MKISQYRDLLQKRFAGAGFDCAQTESDYIISEVTGIPHVELVLFGNRELSGPEFDRARSFAERRLANEPFQYIFGWTPFRDIDLHVAPGVLIPRPETEYLVDLILKALPQESRFCELGTGSGAIALSTAFERPDITVEASEISPAALKIAQGNKEKLGLKNVSLFQGDLFQPFAGKRFHVVAANLPYIPWEEKPSLPPNVRDYEPEEALFAEDGGFAVIERAICECPEYLEEENSAIFFELGETQGPRAVDCAGKTGFFQECRMEKDSFGVPRFLCAFHRGGKK